MYMQAYMKWLWRHVGIQGIRADGQEVHGLPAAAMPLLGGPYCMASRGDAHLRAELYDGCGVVHAACCLRQGAGGSGIIEHPACGRLRSWIGVF